jgi:hypothetical protein
MRREASGIGKRTARAHAGLLTVRHFKVVREWQ